MLLLTLGPHCQAELLALLTKAAATWLAAPTGTWAAAHGDPAAAAAGKGAAGQTETEDAKAFELAALSACLFQVRRTNP